MSQGIFLSVKERDLFSASLTKDLNMEIADRDGMSNLEVVFLEHNILSCSKLYRDMKLDGLAHKLDLGSDLVERHLQDMNSKGKVAITIDHRARLITFKKEGQKGKENREALEKFCVMLEKLNLEYGAAKTS